jgi:hypothetical protein
MPDRILPPNGISVRRWCNSARLSRLQYSHTPGGNPVNIFVAEDAPEIRMRIIAMVRMVAGINVCLDKSQEFGLVPGILRDWLESAGDRPVG